MHFLRVHPRLLALITCFIAPLLATPALAHDPDPTRLPIGDGKVSTTPQRGHVMNCPSPMLGGGAQVQGPWIRADGTFDFNAKAVVEGEVLWPAEFFVFVESGRRVVASNNLPRHPTGVFPVAPGSNAFRYDRNPNAIRQQEFRLALPVLPVVADTPSCLPMGPIGFLLTGGVFFNALDAQGKDAVAHEVQDRCQGHPERSGAYHYHSLTTCLEGAGPAGAHSPLVGYALDGFGIYGRHGEGGAVLANADLDECHGHTHEIEWDGRRASLYHYHATWEYPYTLGCFRGRPQRLGGSTGNLKPPPSAQSMGQSSTLTRRSQTMTEPGMYKGDEFAGKVALVTGAARNIGRAIALSLAAGGARVAVNTRTNIEQARGVVDEIKALGTDGEAYAADVADPAQVQAMVDAVLKRFGRLDILVLNAAIREHVHFDEISFADWRRILSTNLDSVFVFTKACLPALKQSGDGRIITFAGVTALLGQKDRAHVAASKHGIVGMTKALAQDLAEFGVRVNCISPGRIDTSRAPGKELPDVSKDIPLGRKGKPFEIAGMVRSLCGPAGAYVTGQTLHINGGLSNSGV